MGKLMACRHLTWAELGSCKASRGGTRAMRSVPELAASPVIRAKRWGVREPNPGTPSGALKSQEFSDRPMKSRIAGSVDQARRSAARVRSAGAPGAKKGRMSDAARIDSVGGKFAASKGDSVGGGRPGFALDWVRTCVA